ncbi:MAG: amidohydrolase [Chloroflexi bacterium]|nr:amidohydrolase [Chloroflexota bacterium]MCI0800363.1 amidohydrolase [Chloroflexota bacterium]MCI0828917.1 amidohydrolase [Chloroflexota bacterium]MCI0849260.1 amidohydrolase [Chloroflexota bacterium]
MPSKEDLKRRAAEIIDSKADELTALAKTILKNPEPGFREVKTAMLVAQQFGALGMQPRSGLGVTGVRADASGTSPGPTVAVLGELDSLIVSDHPHANPDTGAAHACGHHCQIAMMLGAAMALTNSDVLTSLAGRIAFMAVPAEEYIEIEFRNGLREQGKIEFLGGKAEFVRLGEFDDVHLAMMLHTTSNPAEKLMCISNTNNGTVAKRIQFIGRASHAGGAPHLGINALNAAMMAMTAINFNRETFRDEDSIRVHPIITKGGEAVSAVPADVRMETFVRGRTLEAIMDANAKVDRALKAGAMAVGAQVKIQTIPGYMPLQQNKAMAEIFRANAAVLVGEENVGYVDHRGGSTDMGDISHLMPVIHPYVGGATGLGHGATYVIEDYSLAVIKGAKALAYTVIDLLADYASQGNNIAGDQRPDMSIPEYLKFMRDLASEEVFDGA